MGNNNSVISKVLSKSYVAVIYKSLLLPPLSIIIHYVECFLINYSPAALCLYGYCTKLKLI
ncbi:hypothetical protein CWB66_21530 [Pseudoalteromonas sp. S558]|nr:hypothetical protein CWB66_21530 [Pseudoalteromonas sp. S558]